MYSKNHYIESHFLKALNSEFSEKNSENENFAMSKYVDINNLTSCVYDHYNITIVSFF